MTSPGVRVRPRLWVAVVAIGWGLVLAGAIGWALVRGKPTAREQTTVADAQPAVERATAEVATAASVDGHAVVAITGFDRVGECHVTIFRSGERYQRVVDASVVPGTEQALMERVAAGLPAAYGATVHAGKALRLTGDAGLWVRLTGSVSAPGRVRFVLDTGACRPLGNVATVEDTVDDTAGDRSPVQAVLAKLGVTASRWSTFHVACPGGGSISTVEVVAAVGDEGGPAVPLDGTLREIGKGAVVVATPDLYAYRDGTTGVAVRADPTGVEVTATTGCA
jgi:hypothetical protein